MAKANVSKGKIIGITLYVLVLLVLCGVFVFAGYFTNWFTTDFVSFYVAIDGENVLEDKNEITLVDYVPLDVDVKYTFGWIDKDLTGYSLELKANPGVDFKYSVGEDEKSFQDESIDWLQFFDVEQKEDSFSILTKYTSIESMLRALYPEQELTLPDNIEELKDVDVFSLTVYSADKSAHITLGIRLAEGPKSITIDPSEIVF